MKEDTKKFYENLNPLLKSIYEDASKEDNSHSISFLSDTVGRYCENELCGEGGMKRVFAGDDNFTGRQVAMARMKDLKNSDSFLREVKLLSRLEHPNIVPIYDVGMDDGNEPYLIMKLLGGNQLVDILKKMSEKEINYDLAYLLEIFLKVCDASAYAHSKDIIHADIKPENIQIDDYGSVLLCDWGLACDISNEVILKRRQSNGKAEGTPGSMAPEQLSDEFGALTVKTDIYSLGCLLYSILSLKPPLAGENIDTVIEKTLEGNIPDVDTVSVNTVPSALAAVASRSMALKPEERYDSVDQLTNEIRSYLNGFATKAEEAGILKKAVLFIKRNKRSCSIALISVVLLTLVISVMLGEVATRQNLAEAAFQEAEMQKNVKDSMVKIAEGNLLEQAEDEFRRSNLAAAKKLADKAIAINPGSKRAHQLLGRYYFLVHNFEKAESHFKKLPEDQSLFRRLNSKKFKGQLSDEELIEALANVYMEVAIIHQMPAIYSKLSHDEKIKLAMRLIELYRAGKSFEENPSVEYDAERNMIKITGLRLRSLSFINGLGLSEFVAQNCNISNASTLNHVSLKKLNLENSLIRGIDDLRTKASDYLNVSGTNLLSHLFMERQKAAVMDLSYTELIWFTRLENLTHLKKVILSPNQYKIKNLKKINPSIEYVQRVKN